MQFVITKIQHHRWPSSFARCSLAYILSIWVFQIWLEIWKVPRNSLTLKDFCIVWGFIAISNFSERRVMLQMVSWISHYHLVWTREQGSVVDTLVSINYNSSGPLNNILSTRLCPCSVFRPRTRLRMIQMTAVFTGGVPDKTCFTGDQMSWLTPEFLEKEVGGTDSIPCGHTRIGLDNICCQPILKMRLIETNLVQNKRIVYSIVLFLSSPSPSPSSVQMNPKSNNEFKMKTKELTQYSHRLHHYHNPNHRTLTPNF